MGGGSARGNGAPEREARRRRLRGMSLVLGAGTIIVLGAACASSQTLPDLKPAREPSGEYPAYTPPREDPSDATPSPADPPVAPNDATVIPPEATDGEATPSPTPSAAASDPDPSASQPATPAPSSEELVLATADWSPRCGFGFEPPDPNPRLDVEIDLPERVEAGQPVPITIHLSNAYGETIQAERYYAVVTLTQDGEVVSDRGPIAESESPVTLDAGASLDLTMTSRLSTSCEGAAEAAAAPTETGTASTMRLVAATVAPQVDDPDAGPREADAPTATPPSDSPEPEATPSASASPPTPSSLAPGTYLVGVTVHIARDGGVVASAHASLTVGD